VPLPLARRPSPGSCCAPGGRPHVTLKLALTLDGAIALANGQSRWITGPQARAHCHAERARADAILVGGGTLRADAPRLDVRLPGLEARSPRAGCTRGPRRRLERGGRHCRARRLRAAQWLFVEGGAGAAAAFLRADMVDRLLLYRAPILVGPGLPPWPIWGWTLAPRMAAGRWRVPAWQRHPDHLPPPPLKKRPPGHHVYRDRHRSGQRDCHCRQGRQAGDRVLRDGPGAHRHRASIACSGVCLTVVDKGGKAGDAWFAVDVSAETISRTAPAQWQAGAPINLEPALRLGDELGGHIVTGHVDALGEVVSVRPKAAACA
jgi:hypothetical protein